MPARNAKPSLDEIYSKRGFSVQRTAAGQEALFKITKAPASWNADERSATFVMTTQEVDRYGDIVFTDGIDTKDFIKNPVVLFAHNSRGFPIGIWSKLQVTTSGRKPAMEGKANFSPEGTTPEADTAAKLVAASILRACSIGFMPNMWESRFAKDGKWEGYNFLESELLECSVCSVPAHPKALVKSAGGDEGLALQAIELVLDEWARTPDGLIVPRSKYEEAYFVERNTEVSFHEVRSVDEDPTDAEGDGVVQKMEGMFDRFLTRLEKVFTPKAAEPVIVDPPLVVDPNFEKEVEKELAATPVLATEEEVQAARARSARLLAAE